MILGQGRGGQIHSAKRPKRSLFFSTGAHGLRHSYAQERMRGLIALGLSRFMLWKQYRKKWVIFDLRSLKFISDKYKFTSIA